MARPQQVGTKGGGQGAGGYTPNRSGGNGTTSTQDEVQANRDAAAGKAGPLSINPFQRDAASMATGAYGNSVLGRALGAAGGAGFNVPGAAPPMSPEQQAHYAWLQQQSVALNAQNQDLNTREQMGAFLDPDAVNTRDRPGSYLGTSADGNRDIERLGDPQRLNDQASGLANFDQMTSAAIGQQGAGADMRGMNLRDSARALQGADTWGGLGLQSRNAMMDRLTAPGPSAAEMQMRSGQQAAARQALSMSRSGRGYGGGAGVEREAMLRGEETLGNVANQAAGLRAQEEATRTAQMGQLAALDQSAQANYAGQGAAFRGQALGALGAEGAALGQQGQLAGTQTGAQANAQAVNAQNRLQTDKYNADYANYKEPNNTAQTIGAVSSGLGAAFGAAAPLMSLSDIRSKSNIRPLESGMTWNGGGGAAPMAPIDLSGFEDFSAAFGAPGQALGQAAGQAAYQAGALSDERSKQKIRELQAANAALSDAFGSAANASPEGAEMYGRAADIAKGNSASERFARVPSYSYEYKDPSMPGAAPGEQVGPMAQDLAKELPGAVGQDRSTGMLTVDPDRVALANASATGEIARDLERVKRETEEQRRILAALRPAMGGN